MYMARHLRAASGARLVAVTQVSVAMLASDLSTGCRDSIARSGAGNREWFVVAGGS